MTVFEKARGAHSRAIDVVYAECWLFRPMAASQGDVNARAAPDPERCEIEIGGAFLEPYARAFSGETRRQGLKAESPGHASARPQIDFDLAQLPYKPRRGDRVLRHKTGALYHLAEIKFPEAGTRVQVDLNILSAPASGLAGGASGN